MVEWLKRCKKFITSAADCRKWESRCGRYRVDERNIRYGRGDSGYPIYYYAMLREHKGWRLLSVHRKRSAAIKQCEYYAEHGVVKPKPKKKRKKLC